MPASQMSLVDCEVSWSGSKILKSSSQIASVRQIVRNTLSMNIPFAASSELAFFMYV